MRIICNGAEPKDDLGRVPIENSAMIRGFSCQYAHKAPKPVASGMKAKLRSTPCKTKHEYDDHDVHSGSRLDQEPKQSKPNERISECEFPKKS